MIAKAVIEGFAWIIILAGCASILIETIARFIEDRRREGKRGDEEDE